MSKKKMTPAEARREIKRLQKIVESKQEKVIPTGKFTLEIVDAKDKEPIYSLRGLTAEELHWWRRDLYKIIVRGMKKKISMSAKPEFKKVGEK